ncbi:MAG: GHKL domain-containing protein [Clostridia bacterium]
MSKLKKILPPIVIILLIVPMVFLFYSSIHQYHFFGTWKDPSAEVLTEFSLQIDDQVSDLTLPYTFRDGEPNQTYTLTTEITDYASQRLYVKSVYSPFRVYANGELLFSYGEKGTYPDYLDDPPVKVVLIELPNEPNITLQIEYDYPTTRDDLIIQSLLVGTYPLVFSNLISQQAHLSFLFIFLIGFGILLLLIGVFLFSIQRHDIAFIWLGLINICCGLWGFGEYDITGIIIHNPALLYLAGFVGIFYLPVPIHFFFASLIGYRNPKPVKFCGFACFLVASTATILQATSIISFYNALMPFAIFATLSFVFSIAYTVREWLVHENQMAKLCLSSWAIIICSALAEIVYFLGNNTDYHGLFAQIGLVLFILSNSIILGIVIRRSFALKEQNRRLENEHKMMELQVNEQKRYHNLLIETRQTIRQQRHDLHHHLAVIQNLAKEGNIDKLNKHINSLNEEIPIELKSYCENIAVNTVVTYYASKANENNIKMTIKLIVPETTNRISDNNLCVVFGNILENAIEACQRMESDGKFITLNSHIQNEMLAITLKNSFEGTIRKKEDKFYSAKREEFGIGITSVQTVARKHGGNANFTVEGSVFKSAIYVRI